jgi:hypothetical protein
MHACLQILWFPCFVSLGLKLSTGSTCPGLTCIQELYTLDNFTEGYQSQKKKKERRIPFAKYFFRIVLVQNII